MNVSVRINGEVQEHDVEPRMLLVHYLRDVVGLTGTNIGCDTSSCGACTVLWAASRSSPAPCWRPRPTVPTSRPSRAWPPATGCTRCRRRSASTTPCSAATARPAW